VDADLRRPCVAATFDVPTARGLGDVLSGLAPLESSLIRLNSPNLHILPAGEASDDRAHLIVSTAMHEVITALRTQFDFIVLDAAPIIPYADGRALSTVADGIVFVTRSGTTPGRAMVRSMELLYEVSSAPLVSIVLNAHDVSARDYSYYGYRN
jgi:capsular exopolysaccharide synthesis family protein